MHLLFYIVNLHTSILFCPQSMYYDPSIGMSCLPTYTTAVHTCREHKTRDLTRLTGSTNWRCEMILCIVVHWARSGLYTSIPYHV